MFQLRAIEQPTEPSATAIQKDHAAIRERLGAILDEVRGNLDDSAAGRVKLRRRFQDEDVAAASASLRAWPVPAASVAQEISYAVALERSGKHRKALDKLYRALDRLVRSGRFSECDRILEEINVDQMNTHLLVGVLTITAPDSQRLASRAGLFRRVRTRLSRLAPERSERLLAGLE